MNAGSKIFSFKPWRRLLRAWCWWAGVLGLGLLSPFNAIASEPAVVRSEFIFEQAPFPACHASTIVEARGGELVAAWFGGTREKDPDVGIWLSRCVDGHWLLPIEVADGVQNEKLRYPTWNPVLFQPSQGPLLLFYKVGPSPSQWWGLLKTSTDGGKSWSEARRLPNGILGPVKNKPVELKGGVMLCPSSTESSELGWQVHFERSTDAGKTWSSIGPINTKADLNLIQPSILFYPDGRLQALCRSREGVIAQTWSDDQGASWSKPTATPLPNPNSGTDAVTLADGRQLLVYNHTTKGRSPLNIGLSRDGLAWSSPVVLEDSAGEYSYPAVIQMSDGMVHVTYTWKRTRIKHVVLDPRKL